jgi:hypothetical protein
MLNGPGLARIASSENQTTIANSPSLIDGHNLAGSQFAIGDFTDRVRSMDRTAWQNQSQKNQTDAPETPCWKSLLRTG